MKKEVALQLMMQAVRLASNILIETTGNHRTHLSPLAMEAYQAVTSALLKLGEEVHRQAVDDVEQKVPQSRVNYGVWKVDCLEVEFVGTFKTSMELCLLFLRGGAPNLRYSPEKPQPSGVPQQTYYVYTNQEVTDCED